MINLQTHPWQVVVYTTGASTPVRVFPGYRTQRDAQGYADHLSAQSKRNGWTHDVRVEQACERCGSIKPTGQSCGCFDNGCQ